MSDSSLDCSWGDAVRRLASEFDERLGSPAAEIVTFEAAQRAIAVGIAMAGSCTRLPIGKLLAGAGRTARHRRKGFTRRTKDGMREFARIHRVIVLGCIRCVNRVYVLRGDGGKMYALHGIGSERVEGDLLADMDAIAQRLVKAG